MGASCLSSCVLSKIFCQCFGKGAPTESRCCGSELEFCMSPRWVRTSPGARKLKSPARKHEWREGADATSLMSRLTSSASFETSRAVRSKVWIFHIKCTPYKSEKNVYLITFVDMKVKYTFTPSVPSRATRRRPLICKMNIHHYHK